MEDSMSEVSSMYRVDIDSGLFTPLTPCRLLGVLVILSAGGLDVHGVLSFG